MSYQISLYPQVKQWAIITYKHGIYDFFRVNFICFSSSESVILGNVRKAFFEKDLIKLFQGVFFLFFELGLKSALSTPLIHYLSCKKNTVKKTKQNRLMFASNCAVCGNKKPRFIKIQEVH